MVVDKVQNTEYYYPCTTLVVLRTIFLTSVRVRLVFLHPLRLYSNFSACSIFSFRRFPIGKPLNFTLSTMPARLSCDITAPSQSAVSSLGKRKRQSSQPDKPHWTSRHEYTALQRKHWELMSGSRSPLQNAAALHCASSSANGFQSVNSFRNDENIHGLPADWAWKIHSLGPMSSPKRRRVVLTRMTNGQKHNLPTYPIPLHPCTESQKNIKFSGPVSSLLLRPCHICHRRPTTRAVLDGYIDCEDCGSRTCFICMRECESEECRHAERSQDDAVLNGPDYCQRSHSQRRKVCSSCSVESIDSEGRDTVTCLDCHLHKSDLKGFLSYAADTEHWPS
jgi:hypothetical protein